MWKKTLKITGIILGSIFLLIILFYTKAYIGTKKRIDTQYTIQPEKIKIPTDSAAIALGETLSMSKGCRDCHGSDLGGQIFIDDALGLGVIIAKNITYGKGGLPRDYGYEDWLRVLKHGVNKEKKSILIMPSYEFAQLTKSDMTALIAYLWQAPKVDRELPATKLGPLSIILTELNQLPLLPAEKVDHNQPFVAEITPSVSFGYGKYLSIGCQGCHREHMKGGDPIAPGFPPVADISSTGQPGRWTDEQFIATMRTGETPEGKKLDPNYMPWKAAAGLNDLELKALHLYLKSI